MAGFLWVNGITALSAATAKGVSGDNDNIVSIIANLKWLAGGE
jgi:hypothetical protein